MDALRRLGPCELHRRSWRLPGTMDDNDDGRGMPAEPLVDASAPGAEGTDDAYLTAATDLTRVGER